MSQAKVEALTAAPGKEKTKHDLVFQATLHHLSPIVEKTVGKDGRPRVMISVGDYLLPLIMTPRMTTAMQGELPSGLQKLTLYPRTNGEGILGPGTALSRCVPTEVPELREYPLHVLGRLVRVDRNEGLIIVRIYPNQGTRGGRVFHLPLVASLELIEGLPEPGRGVFVEGTLRPRSLRLVALKVSPSKLPPRADAERRGEGTPASSVGVAEH